jgi:hypothetical protein
MTRGLSIRTVAIIALLLPGLVIAAPIAGACGLCGDGDACHMKQPIQQVSESHSCCGETPAEAPPAPSLGSLDCECGREAPPALTAASPTSVETAFMATSTHEDISSTTPVRAVFSDPSRPSAPPPAPPAYLIDCAFLT